MLKGSLETGFEENGGLEGRRDLVRRLLGSPALVGTLRGMEKVIAVQGYVVGLKALFGAGAGLAMLMVLVQAATGWRKGVEEKGVGDGAHVEGSGIGVEDEEWEEGMEQGV